MTRGEPFAGHTEVNLFTDLCTIFWPGTARWHVAASGGSCSAAQTRSCQSMCRPREAARAVHAPFTCTRGGNAAGFCFPDLAVPPSSCNLLQLLLVPGSCWTSQLFLGILENS